MIGFYFRLHEKREIVPQGAPHALLESPGERRNRSVRLIERDAFDALHREKQSGKADALSFGSITWRMKSSNEFKSIPR